MKKYSNSAIPCFLGSLVILLFFGATAPARADVVGTVLKYLDKNGEIEKSERQRNPLRLVPSGYPEDTELRRVNKERLSHAKKIIINWMVAIGNRAGIQNQAGQGSVPEFFTADVWQFGDPAIFRRKFFYRDTADEVIEKVEKELVFTNEKTHEQYQYCNVSEKSGAQRLSFSYPANYDDNMIYTCPALFRSSKNNEELAAFLLFEVIQDMGYFCNSNVFDIYKMIIPRGKGPAHFQELEFEECVDPKTNLPIPTHR